MRGRDSAKACAGRDFGLGADTLADRLDAQCDRKGRGPMTQVFYFFQGMALKWRLENI